MLWGVKGSLEALKKQGGCDDEMKVMSAAACIVADRAAEAFSLLQDAEQEASDTTVLEMRLLAALLSKQPQETTEAIAAALQTRCLLGDSLVGCLFTAMAALREDDAEHTAEALKALKAGIALYAAQPPSTLLARAYQRLFYIQLLLCLAGVYQHALKDAARAQKWERRAALSRRTHRLVLSLQPFNIAALRALSGLLYAQNDYTGIIALCEAASSSYISDELSIFVHLNKARCLFFLVASSPPLHPRSSTNSPAPPTRSSSPSAPRCAPPTPKRSSWPTATAAWWN